MQYNYPNFNQDYYSNYRLTPQLKGRYVSSVDEARAAQIDFDGSISVFPDLANNVIYTKQINLDGTLSLQKYELSKETTSAENNYVTKEELIDELTKLRETLGKEKENGKSISKSTSTELPAF